MKHLANYSIYATLFATLILIVLRASEVITCKWWICGLPIYLHAFMLFLALCIIVFISLKNNKNY